MPVPRFNGRTLFGAALVSAAAVASSVMAEVDVIAIDFGQSPAPSCGESPLYAGSFDGSSGFVAMTLSDCGAVESPSLDLGDGVTLQFTNVSGWNNTDGVGPDEVQALTGDHFFTGGSQGADDPAAFSISGLAPDDILVFELVDRRGGESALVTFEGITTLVSSDAAGEFTDVSLGGVTGKTTYGGFFTGPEGSGEGNLAGARVTIISPESAPCIGDFNGDGDVNGADFGALLAAWGKCGGCPEDLDGNGVVAGSDLGVLLSVWGECPGGGGPTGACCLGEACWQVGEADCAEAGGSYKGDGSECGADTCEPPVPGSCCEVGEAAGCIDLICANAVCQTLPDCCDVQWDADCADLAIELCNNCDGTTDVNVYAVDFGQAPGCGPSPVFSGTFDGTSGFVGLTLSDCGVVESPSLDLGGGVTLEFVNVSGWNNTDGFPANEVPALTGDHFLSSALGADDPVSFSISGLDPSDLLIFELVDRRGSETALVTFEGITTLVKNEEIGEFTDVSGGGVSGKSVYTGFFTGPEGGGEGNLSGARITVIKTGGKGVVGACCLGENCWQVGEAVCNAAGGEYLGNGVDCDAESCVQPGLLACCEEGTVPGCIDLTCSYVVCLTLPDCCDVLWDADCATLATAECNDCDGTTNTKVAAIDFGQSPGAADGCNGPSPVYTGAFDGIDGFVGMEISDCGLVESPVLNIGSGVTLQFVNVSGWNNTDGVGPDVPQALTGDHFFSSAAKADDPVQFTVSGLNPCSTLILEFVDRRGNEAALVTFEGITTLVDAVPDNGGTFTDVSGGGLTGQSSYAGSFTGAGGSGEGNLAGARITVIPGDPGCEGDVCDGGIGDCGEAQSGPGCGCSTCEEIVCEIDPICCEINWDSFCANLAENNCVP